MNGLIISTISDVFIYVVKNDEFFYFGLNKLDSQRSSEKLLPLISDSLQKKNLKLSDLQFVAVCNGVGSFTGVRVGLVTSKMICHATNAKLILFNNFEVLRLAEKELNNNTEFIKLCAAYAGGAFSEIDNNFNYLNAKQLDDLRRSKITVLIPEMETEYFFGCKIISVSYMKNLKEIVKYKLTNKIFTDYKKADALYVINSQAENELDAALKSIKVELCDIKDASALSLIETECFTENVYNIDMIIDELKSATKKYYKILFRGKIVGFVGFNVIDKELELLKIAIVPMHRGKGLSKVLFENAIKNFKYEKVFLEVNKNNEIAINLYKRLGFKKISVRKMYYSNGDDAYIYELTK